MTDANPALSAGCRRQSPALWAVEECQGLFIDALVLQQNGLLAFASLWGRDTACQEFLGRLSVPIAEGGIDGFAAGPLRAAIGAVDRLDKVTGRVPRGCLFDDLVHLMLFDPLCQTPDPANRRAVLLYEVGAAGDDGPPLERLWALVQETCPLPLLAQWRDAVLEAFTAQGWMDALPAAGRLRAHRIDLGERKALEALIHEMVLAGRLRLPGEAA